jgi:hypothetical protein
VNMTNDVMIFVGVVLEKRTQYAFTVLNSL